MLLLSHFAGFTPPWAVTLCQFWRVILYQFIMCFMMRLVVMSLTEYVQFILCADM